MAGVSALKLQPGYRLRPVPLEEEVHCDHAGSDKWNDEFVGRIFADAWIASVENKPRPAVNGQPLPSNAPEARMILFWEEMNVGYVVAHPNRQGGISLVAVCKPKNCSPA